MSRQLLLVTILFFNACLFGQTQSNIWYFGQNAGIDFNNSIAQPITNGKILTSEGCASMCDNNGNLLFYTDGKSVFNKDHSLMDNGDNLKGHKSSSQSSIIVPRPNHDSLYYVFTVDHQASSNGLRYSIVNINGSGSVVEKNVLLANSTCEKITAITHSNGIDIWIVTRLFNSNTYQSYILNESGLETIPIETNIGMMIAGNVKKTIGYMKPSHDGNRLAVCHNFTDSLELFDFDRSNGRLSNVITLSTFASVGSYGLEFSPNNNLLYVSTESNSGIIYQYNLLAGIEDSIQSQRIVLNQDGESGMLGALQLAPDGKIYAARWYKTHIGVINEPNLVGTLCQYNPTAFSLDGKYSLGGLPNTGKIFINTASLENYVVCQFDSLNIDITTNYGDSVHWFLNGQFVSSVIPPFVETIELDKSGLNNLHAVIFDASIRDTLISTIEVLDNPSISIGTDTAICQGDTLFGTATYIGDSFYWNNAENSLTQTFTKENWIWAEASSEHCGSIRDSFYLKVDTISFELGPPILSCLGENIVLSSTESLDSIKWSNGQETLSVSASGAYSATAYKGACIDADIKEVHFDSLSLNLGNDILGCYGEPINLTVTSVIDSLHWSTGEKINTITVNEDGLYWVKASNGLCEATDTIRVLLNEYPRISLGPDIRKCVKDSIVRLSVDGDFDFTWSDGSKGNTFFTSELGPITVTADNFGCLSSDSIQILEGENCKCNLFIPTAFTPNGDGQNEVFKVIPNGCEVENYHLTIYSRWGEIVYESSDIEMGWDGIFHATKAQQGAYLFVVKHSLDNQTTVRKGTVTLLR